LEPRLPGGGAHKGWEEGTRGKKRGSLEKGKPWETTLFTLTIPSGKPGILFLGTGWTGNLALLGLIGGLGRSLGGWDFKAKGVKHVGVGIYPIGKAPVARKSAKVAEKVAE